MRESDVEVELTEQQRQGSEDEEYDDSPWTREELEALAWEAGKQLVRDNMDEYDALVP